jgi:serine/threonine protein kinase
LNNSINVSSPVVSRRTLFLIDKGGAIKMAQNNTGSSQQIKTPKHMAATIVAIHYKIGKKIGEGSFGVIYEGTSLLNDQQVAVKFEPRKSDVPEMNIVHI